MIRINLLGQARPRAGRRPVDTGAALPMAFIGIGVVVGLVVLAYFYHSLQTQLSDENNKIKTLTAQKTELHRIKQQVESFEKQKQVLQQRVTVIEQLPRARPAGQEPLDIVANTLSRTENLWLPPMTNTSNSIPCP